ncbi:MAG: hypothetical protein AAGU11_04540 [Syntrophobacteraceae bacterium]
MAVLYLLIIVFCAIALHYVAEVLIGASTCMYRSELGMEPRNERSRRMSHVEFFSRLAPFVAITLGVPMGISLLLR